MGSGAISGRQGENSLLPAPGCDCRTLAKVVHKQHLECYSEEAQALSSWA
jgi:hypothetical protein